MTSILDALRLHQQQIDAPMTRIDWDWPVVNVSGGVR